MNLFIFEKSFPDSFYNKDQSFSSGRSISLSDLNGSEECIHKNKDSENPPKHRTKDVHVALNQRRSQWGPLRLKVYETHVSFLETHVSFPETPGLRDFVPVVTVGEESVDVLKLMKG